MMRCVLFKDIGGITPLNEWEVLGRIDIANDVVRSWENPRRGTYIYEIYKKLKKAVWMKGEIPDFPRLSYHPWNLVRDILNDAAKRNGGRL
jgi:hypothetical protein